MGVHAKLGESLLASLNGLRKQKDHPSLDDIGVMLEQMIQSVNPTNQGMYTEIKKLSDLIDNAKKEVSTIGAEDSSSDVTMHLEEVIKTTEEAGHSIIDAMEEIQTIAAGTDIESLISEVVMKVYEACNFQDLTGQRLNKVIKLLAELDARIANMLDVFGVERTEKASKGDDAAAQALLNSFDEAALLNGPQADAPSQADVDALFDSLSFDD